MDFLSEAKKWAEQQGLKAALIDVSSRIRSASTSIQSNLLDTTTNMNNDSNNLLSPSKIYMGSMDTPYILSYQQLNTKGVSIPSTIEPNLRNTNDNISQLGNTSSITVSNINDTTSPTTVPNLSDSSSLSSTSTILSSPLRSSTKAEHIASTSKTVIDRTPQSNHTISLLSSSLSNTSPSTSSNPISYPLSSSLRISTPIIINNTNTDNDHTIHGPSMHVPHLVNANIVGDEDGGFLVARIRELESQVIILTQTSADARSRAATAEARCVTLESALERYAAQGATLEGQIEGLGTAMRQELSKMALEVETATARAVTAETALEEIKQIEINLRTEAANAAREAATVMDSFREQAEAALLREQNVSMDLRKQIESLQNELTTAKAQTTAAENKANESATDVSISKREAAAAREMAVTAEAHLAASQRELDRLRNELAELSTRVATSSTNVVSVPVNTTVSNLPPLPVSNPPSLNNSFSSVNSNVVNNSVVINNRVESTTIIPVWPVRKVVFTVHGIDTPTLVPLPPVDESVAVKIQDTGSIVVTDNDVQRVCPASIAVDASVNTPTNNDIPLLVRSGLEGRSSVIFIANAPSLGDLPLHQCIINTAKELFNQLSTLSTSVANSKLSQFTKIQHKIKMSIVEVSLDISNGATNSKEIIRDILDIQQKPILDGSTMSTPMGNLYAPLISLENTSSENTVPVTSRALNIDIDNIEGVDALVEMALLQRAAIRAQETPSSATTLEIAALTNRNHIIVTFAINHIVHSETASDTKTSSVPSTTQFTSRLHIVQLACPAHIGIVSQAGAVSDIAYNDVTTKDNIYNEPLGSRLSNEIMSVAKAETLFATNSLQTLSNVWIKLVKGNNGTMNELKNRLILDTIANESTLTAVISDALSPSCGHLFCVNVPPRLSYTLDADAVAFLMAGSDMYDAIPPPAPVVVPLPTTSSSSFYQQVTNTPATTVPNANIDISQHYPRSEASRIAETAAATAAMTVAAKQVLGRRNSNTSTTSNLSNTLPTKFSPSSTSVWTSNGPIIVDLDSNIKYMDTSSMRRASRQFNSVDNRTNIGTGLSTFYQQSRRRSTSSTTSKASSVPTIEEYIRSGGPEKAKHIVSAELDNILNNNRSKRSVSTGKSTDKKKSTVASTTLSTLLNRNTNANNNNQDNASIASSSRRSISNISTGSTSQRRRSRSEERKPWNSNAPATTTIRPTTVTKETTTRSNSNSRKRSTSVSSKTNTTGYISLEQHMQQAMNKHLGRSTTISLGEKSRTGLVVSNIPNTKISKDKPVSTIINESISSVSNSNNSKTILTSRDVLSDLDAAIANEIQETLRLEEITNTTTTNNNTLKRNTSSPIVTTIPSIPSTIPTNTTLPATRKIVQPPSPPSIPPSVPQSSSSSPISNTNIVTSEPVNPVPAMRQLLSLAKSYFHYHNTGGEPFRLNPNHFDQLRAYMVSVAIDNTSTYENTNGNIFLNSNSFTFALNKWLPVLSIHQLYNLLELMGLHNILSNTIDVMDFVDALEALAQGEGY